MPLSGQHALLQAIQQLTRKHLHGKERPLRLALVALLSGGHILLEDIPGLGKTTMALALANALGLTFGRIQCTSDLLPSDITGLSVFNRETSAFTFVRGPIFSHILLIDEVNRAMPKTQSALLEAMEERQVTVEGTTYPLPEPFLVIATQNPSEQVGTYPLPESQMDRFLVRTGMGYPPPEVEKEIIQSGSIRETLRHIPTMVTAAEILAARAAVAGITIAPTVVDYIYRVVAATREHPQVQTGISTRGAINLAEAAKVQAYLAGRAFVIPEDVQEMVVPVSAHRLVLGGELEGPDKEQLLREIVATIPVPRS